MSDFSFTATAECDRCGNLLSSSTEDCDKCSPEDLSRYHFEHMLDDAVVTVWSVTPERAWHDLMEKVEEPLPWRCTETNETTLDAKQRGTDVREIHDT